MSSHNPFLSVNEPSLLVLNLLVVLIVWSVCLWAISRLDRSDHLKTMPAPPLDPYHIAYLHTGSDGVLRLAIYKLLKNGDLICNGNPQNFRDNTKLLLISTKKHSAIAEPTKIESFLVAVLQQPKSTYYLFHSDISIRADRLCSEYREWVDKYGLVLSGLAIKQSIRIRLTGAAILIAGALIECHFTSGTSVSLVAKITLVAVVIGGFIWVISNFSKQSKQGQLVLNHAKEATIEEIIRLTSLTDLSGDANNQTLLAVASRGMAALRKTADEDLVRVIYKGPGMKESDNSGFGIPGDGDSIPGCISGYGKHGGHGF